ncbi:MAG: serine hydrolase domain-containing protein [Pseudomonadota bacterium]
MSSTQEPAGKAKLPENQTPSSANNDGYGPFGTQGVARGSGAAAVVANLLEEGVVEGSLPGAVVLASVAGKMTVSCVIGNKLPSSEVADKANEQLSMGTVFDLGQLTQSICTATLMMRLASAGKISPTDRASRFLQALGVGQKSSMTLAHLLSHSAGFPSGASVYEELVRANAGPRPGILSSSGAKQYAYTHFHNLPLKYEPGARELESDANFIVLGEICEIITGLPLEKAYSRYVAAPLKVSSLNFIDLTILRRRGLEPAVELFAPSGRCPRRGRLIAGEVWDENAWVMGGVAGHSGLFGTAADVHTWAREVLKGYHGISEIFTPEAVQAFVASESVAAKSDRKLGFESPSVQSGFVAKEVAPAAFVTASSTGSSVYIDPSRDAVVVMLSNGGFSGHHSRRFLPLRSDIHAAVLDL